MRVKANLPLNLSCYDFRKALSKVTNNITRVRIVGTSKFFTLPDERSKLAYILLDVYISTARFKRELSKSI